MSSENTEKEESNYACKMWACQELSACRKCMLRRAQLNLYKQIGGFVWSVRIKQVSCKQAVVNESVLELDIIQPHTWGLLLELKRTFLVCIHIDVLGHKGQCCFSILCQYIALFDTFYFLINAKDRATFMKHFVSWELCICLGSWSVKSIFWKEREETATFRSSESGDLYQIRWKKFTLTSAVQS